MSTNKQNQEKVMAILQSMGAFGNKNDPRIIVRRQKALQKIKTILENGSLKGDWIQFAGKNMGPALRQPFLKKLMSQLSTKTIVIHPVILAYDQIKSMQIQLTIVQNENSQHYFQLMEQKIKNDLNTSKDIMHFFQKQINYIIGILQRRSSLVQYYNTLIQLSKTISNRLTKTIQLLTFIDLIIFLKKVTYPSDIITFLLSKQMGPIPFLYQAQGHLVNDVESLADIFGFVQKYPLIINVWTEEAAATLKTININNSNPDSKHIKPIHFSNLLQIDARYFEGSSFDSNVNLFKIDLRNGKNVILVDFIAYTTKEPKVQAKKHQLVKKLLPSAQLIIFHIDRQNVKDDQTRKEDFFKDHSYLFQSKARRIFFTQNSNSFKSAVQQSLYALKVIQEAAITLQLYYFQQTIQKQGQVNQGQVNKGQVKQGQVKQVSVNQSQAMQFSKFLYNLGFYLPIQQKKLIINQQVPEQSKKVQPVSEQSKDKAVPFISNFLIDQKSNTYLTHYHDIKRLIVESLSKDKEEKLPKISFLKNFYQVEEKIKKIYFKQEQDTNKAIDKTQKTIEQLQALKKKFKKSLDQQSLSKFAQNCRKYIRGDKILLKLFIQIMIQQNNRMVRELLLKSKKQFQRSTLKDNQSRKQYIAKNNKILQSGVLADSVIYQLSIYNELKIDKKAQFQQSKEQLEINTYYSNCLDNLLPFNVINKETPTFGNAALQRFFLQLNQRYQKSDIFVVSVFGPKSSGKSTLLNYLFRCNIFMIEDEFAKGVYMSLCKIDNKIIIVLDAAGILNITFGAVRKADQLHLQSQQLQEQAIFDHEIASILMKESDVVVITGQIQPITQKNKNLLQQRTTLAIGICYKVMDALHVNNSSKIHILPKKLIFCLFNKSQGQFESFKIKDELMTSLQPLLQYQKDNTTQYAKGHPFNRYIYLSLSNIFFLPSIYIGQNSNILNEVYGLKMLEIRNKIVKQLDDLALYRMQQTTMKEFYGDSKVHWQILKKTGKNIVRVQTINQADKRDRLYSAYKDQYVKICQEIIKQINNIQPSKNKLFTITAEQIRQHIYDQKPKGQLKFTDYYKNSWFYFKEKVLDVFTTQLKKKQEIIKISIRKSFQQQANSIVSQNEKSWVTQYIHRIDRLYKSILNRRIKLGFQRYDKLFQVELSNSYFNDISQIIKKINNKTIQNAQQKHHEYIKQTTKFLSQVLLEQIDKNEIRANLINIFQHFLQSEDILLKQLQIKHINDCLSLSMRFPDNSYVYSLNEFVNFQNQEEVSQSNKKLISDLISDSVTLLIKEMKNVFFSEQKSTIVDIFPQFPAIINKINNITSKLQTDIEERSKKIYMLLPQKANKKSRLSKDLQDKKNEILKERQKLLQNQEKLENTNQYDFYQSLAQKLKRYEHDKISLEKINVKILLIGKLFTTFQQMIIQSQQGQIKREKEKFYQIVKEKQIQLNKEVVGKVNSLFEQDLQEQMDLYKTQLSQNFRNKIKLGNQTRVSQYISQINSRLPQQMHNLMKSTLNNPQIQTQTDIVILQNLYKQCFKFLSNPSIYVFQKAKGQLSQTSAVQTSIIRAKEQLQVQIKELTNQITTNFNTTKKILKPFDSLQTYLQQNIVEPKVVIQKIISKLLNVKQIVGQVTNDKNTVLKIKQQLEYFIDTKQEVLTGCKSCCPFCGAKCVLTYNHSDEHQAYSHNLVAFGGCRDQDNKFILEGCLYKGLGLQNYWTYNNQRYQTGLSMVQNKFSKWARDLPKFYRITEKKKHDLNKLGQLTSTNQKDIQVIRWIRLWANIEEIMIQTFKQCFKNSIQPISNKLLDPLKRSSLKKFSFDTDRAKQRLVDYWKKKVVKKQAKVEAGTEQSSKKVNEQKPPSSK